MQDLIDVFGDRVAVTLPFEPPRPIYAHAPAESVCLSRYTEW